MPAISFWPLNAANWLPATCCVLLQHSHLQQELSSCKEALAEAQQEVARLEADSRQLEALRRSSTPNVPVSCSRIPLAPTTARPATAAGNYAAEACAGSGIRSLAGSSSIMGCNPRRSAIPTSPSAARPQTACATVSSSDNKNSMPSPAAVSLTLQLPEAPFSGAAGFCQAHTPTGSCPSSARGSNDAAGILVTPRRASLSAVGPPGFAKGSAGGALHRDLTALRRLSGHSSAVKPQPVTEPAAVGMAAVATAASAGVALLYVADAAVASPSVRRRSSNAAVPLMQALVSPRPSSSGPERCSQ